MKILVVSTVQTSPVTSGSASFINSYTSLLKEMGHELFFLHVIMVLRSRPDTIRGINKSKSQWGDHYFIYRMSVINKIYEKYRDFYSKHFKGYFSCCDDHYIWGVDKEINRLDKIYNFDACLINYYWLSKLFTHINIPKKGIITHDSFVFNNLRNNVKSILNLSPNEESKALQRCPYIFAMQEDEKIFFQTLSPKSKVLISYCNYNFVNQSLNNNHNIVFLSSAFYLNINGLFWFLEKVFPNIINRFEDCRLIIGGNICDVIPKDILKPQITLVGFVDNPETFYNQGDVAINPTFQGTGLKIKTFEAMSYNKITMARLHSLVGCYDKNNIPIFASDNPDDWVDYITKVWTIPGFAAKVREKNEVYINNMNAFIKTQFVEFLKN